MIERPLPYWLALALVPALTFDLAGCGGRPARPERNTVRDAGPGMGSASAQLSEDGGRAPSAETMSGRPGPRLPPEPARLSPLETSCDGNDEDGDGHVDMLIPSGKNRCATGKKGACAQGWTSCLDGKAVCEAPSPSPEVADGIDNDCNGIVDDVAPTSVKPRVLVLGPQYMWADAKVELATVTDLLEQAGVPYDLNPSDRSWRTQLQELGRYSLVVIPGYLESSALDDKMLEGLELFARGGGIVFVMKPIGAPGTNALSLAGVKAARRAPLASSFRILGSSAVALASINSPEERQIPLTDNAQTAPVDAWVFDVDSGTEVIAEAYAGTTLAGAIATRRRIDRGAVYAWGHDLTTFDTSRCYLNCFEPSGDLLRLLLTDSLREGALGHVMLKHPVPGGHRSALLLTHDLSGRDAFNAGAWGQPGALQMAAMEKRNGAKATYFIATDDARGVFRPEVVEELCREGFCPVGANSARHLTSFRQLPRGTCKETRKTYGPNVAPTLCGEVRVSLEVLDDLTHTAPAAWRSPHLANNPALFDVLAEQHVTLDSSFGIGDLKYNLPVDTATTPKLQRLFHRRPLVEFPIAGEDARTIANGGRIELQASNLAWFESAWEYTMLRNAENRAITTLLVHPTRGSDVPADNIGVKVRALEQLIHVAKAHGILLDSLVHFGDHWRARSKVTFEANYDPVVGYTGFIQIGDRPVTDLTFEFGDAIASFDSSACGKAIVRDNLVVLTSTITAGVRCTFTAVPSALAKR